MTEQELDEKLRELAQKCCTKDETFVSQNSWSIFLIGAGAVIGFLIFKGCTSL